MIQQALLVAIWVALPPLVAAAIAGLAVGFAQTAMGQNDPTVAFAPRLLAAALALLFFGAWMLAFTGHYWIALWRSAAQLVR